MREPDGFTFPAAASQWLRRFAVSPRRAVAAAALLGALLALGASQKHAPDLTSAAVGKLPADVQAVTGGYRVGEFENRKVLELPGEPLDVFGLLFGPADKAELDVRARAWSESSGRRFPEFGVGTGDVGGFRLIVLPGQKKLELRKADDAIAAASLPEPWRSGDWTWVRLRVAKRGEGRWTVEGKAWPAAAGEPAAWQVSHEVTEPPQAGRASVWGIPFSGRPIRFDGLGVETELGQ